MKSGGAVYFFGLAIPSGVVAIISLCAVLGWALGGGGDVAGKRMPRPSANACKDCRQVEKPHADACDG